MMKRDFKRFLFLILISIGVFLPSYVSAKDYTYRDFYYKQLPLSNGDRIIINDDHKYICGGGQSCDANLEKMFLANIIYNKKSYGINAAYLNLEKGYVFYYREFINYVLKDGDVTVSNSGSEEDNQLVNSLLKDNSRIPHIYSCSTSSSSGTYSGFGLCLDFDTKIILDLDYLNINGASHENPVSYKREDGTIVLKELQRDGYEFGGWYLDSDYKYRVTELDEGFYNDYFNDSGEFKDIDKIPVRDKNGNLFGKVNLYAKLVPNNGTTGISTIVNNPQTLAPIGIVIVVLLVVGVVTGMIFYKKRKIVIKRYNYI